MKARITKRLIDSLAPPSGKGRLRVYDDQIVGFGLVVHPTGRKMFFVEYGPSKRRRRMTLGPFGALTVDQARALAREHLSTVYQGGDPLTEREAERAMPSVGDWIDSYLAEVERRKKHPRADRSYLGDAKKRWSRRPLDSITVTDVRRAMAEMSDGHPIRGNRWLASVRACLNAAWRADLIPTNPASRVRPNSENPPRARVLTNDELARLVDVLDDWHDPFVSAALQLLILTGARGSEVLRASWADVDLDAATWRIPSPKSGRPQIVPLHAEALDLLRALPRRGPWLIPGQDAKKHRADLDKPWRKIREQAKVPDVHLHDLRRTFGLLVARTAGLHVASKLLRHSTVTVTEQVYAPLGLDDLRAGLDKAAAARGNVIPMRRAKGDGA